MKIVFADGDKICVAENGSRETYESEPILRYREYAASRRQTDEWKLGGEGAKFRGETLSPRERIDAYINGVDWDGDDIVYCFTVNESSGVYRKPRDRKAREEHIYSSNLDEILSVHVQGNKAAVTVRQDDLPHVGMLDLTSSDLVMLTAGDARDGNARADGNVILFDSAGVGRNAQGEFTGDYAPAAILSLDRETLSIEEIKSDKKYAYVRPQRQGGALYCIRRPQKKKGSGVLLDILLFPYRIVKALAGMLQCFSVSFGGESLTSGGDNPARGRKQDGRKLFIDGNEIAVEKETKRNKKFKDREYGFVPASWKLVRIAQEKEEIVASGVCDFSVAGNAVCYTDGRHVWLAEGGKPVKIADTERCLAVSMSESGNRVRVRDLSDDRGHAPLSRQDDFFD